MTTTATKPKMYPAPVHSPNEFHLGPNGELLAGLGETQHPANITPMSGAELSALADREQAVADAENAVEAKKAEALGQIAQEAARLQAEREAFDAEKAAFAREQKKQAGK